MPEPFRAHVARFCPSSPLVVPLGVGSLLPGVVFAKGGGRKGRQPRLVGLVRPY